MRNIYLGVDIGSVSTNIVATNKENEVIEALYIRTQGRPIDAIKEGFRTLKDKIKDSEVLGIGTTGSGRYLGGLILGADIIKNEITAHGVAAIEYIPDVRTIIEIGGQDSKLILIKDGIIYDFAMNTICAAGTGSFIDRQAERLGIPIEELGQIALKSSTNVRIAGRCAVFAESDMIHKQQLGHNEEDIINGLCEALARNYLNNLAKGKTLSPPFVFQGGVSLNIGIVKAFEKILGHPVHVPKNSNVMGAIGAALIAKEEVKKKGYTSFQGFNISDSEFKVKSFECNNCPNMCEVLKFYKDNKLISMLNDKCGRWSAMVGENKTTQTA